MKDALWFLFSFSVPAGLSSYVYLKTGKDVKGLLAWLGGAAFVLLFAAVFYK